MHTIKLQVQESVYDHIMFLLKNLNTKDLRIIEDSNIEGTNIAEDVTKIQVFSDHSANLIDEWKDDSEDDIWK